MQSDDWGALKPDGVSDYINFDRTDRDWTYGTSVPISMPAKQAEGVAGLWNTLALHNLALLADEVGMGKTFQALGVIALLWKMMPSARVLIMAPNQEICRHWIREYQSFLRDHYRRVGDGLKDAAGTPVHEPMLRARMDDLVRDVRDGAGTLFLTTIHALSGLVHDKEGDVLAKAERAAQAVHDALTASSTRPAFDLIVVDEAHYFRNAHGHSQRARAASKFFGGPGSRLGRRVLLMTATPSHSSLTDVGSILGYFAELASEGGKPHPAELLKKYAMRRLRLMQGRDAYHSKYNYRREVALPTSFEAHPEAEMFFALYQKKLVQQQGHQGNKRGYLYGYLEGFESFAQGTHVEDAPLVDGNGEASAKAFRGAADTEILQALTQLHHDAFGRFPGHPKYGTLVKECMPADVFDGTVSPHEHKHLVFVRRIPSVREITQRMNARYDQALAGRIVEAWGLAKPHKVLKRWESERWSRRFFNRLLRQQQAHASAGDLDLTEDTTLADDSADPAGHESLRSQIADLFVVKKGGVERSTDCSNFSLRLRKPESIFSLLLEPAADYREGQYRTHYRRQVGDRAREDYGSAALDTRLAHVVGAPQAHDGAREQLSFREAMPTLWGLMYPLLPAQARDQLDRWSSETGDWRVAENFGRYVRTGFLFASPVIIELYAWFTEFSRIGPSGRDSHSGAEAVQDAQQRYLAFIRWIEPRLPTSLALAYFDSALATFEQVCEKITDHAMIDCERGWQSLASLHSPAWFASGETTHRERLILGFNSPFFPNVLVATSVFQEGVNLHLQCRKVHHYGIAWTPGDNEQRVGRVDRLFGRVNGQLKAHGHTELSIHYPYLTQSFDQEQLASFVRLKHAVEARMDACRHIEFDDAIDLRNANEGWEQYLRKPSQEPPGNDPFPALFEPDRMPSHPYRECTDA